MFLQVCVCPRGDAWRGGMCGGGHAWREVCMAGGCAWQGAYVAGGVHGRGACVAGGMCDRGGMHGRGCAYHTCPPMTLRDTVGQRAGGMHPTGMHSCLFLLLQ